MPLNAGTRLGPYEIVAPLGAGGMGEVYRARDARLGRDVAIKVLPASVSADPERLARFEQEARATASLNHPNILALHDIGTHAGDGGAAGAPYLVTELLEGETLRDRLGRGPLPQRKAIECATQIAAGLAAAHDRGIAHRDLKPENVFVTGDGHVKILDFGLAKLRSPAGGLPEGGPYVGGVQNTALATSPGTAAGVVLGTVGYMAPEQVKGLPADHRSDIFALGATLYEMLAGRRAFQRNTAPETMTAILNEEPQELSGSQHPVPLALDRIVRRCLEKNPSARFQSARDLAFALENLSSASGVTEGIGSAPVARTPTARTRERVLVAAVLVLAAATAGLLFWSLRPRPAPPLVAFTLSPPDGAVMQGFALSPAGRALAFVAAHAGKPPLLYLRSLDAVTATPLAGTEGARNPFWSPDGRSIGFFADETLKIIPASGGPVRAICKVDGARGWGTWNGAGVILFSTENRNPIRQVTAEGGVPAAVTRVDATRDGPSGGHFRPTFLPDGRRFLYFSGSTLGGALRFASLDSPDDTLVVDGIGWGQYVEPGYLVFVRGPELFAQPFDVSTGRVSGRAISVGRVGDLFNSSSMVNRSGFSASGTMLAVQTLEPAADTTLVWFDRQGKRVSILGKPGSYRNPRLSPDGLRLAVQQRGGSRAEVWTYDVERNVGTPVSLGPDVAALLPLWLPQGDRILLLRRPGGLLQVPIGGGKAETISRDTTLEPNSVSADGGFLAFTTINVGTNRDIGAIPLGGGAAIVIANGVADEVHAQLNPNGRWVAYESDESGTVEIYVQRFPSGGDRVRVSSTGGVQPRWRGDGRELYYLVPVAVTAGVDQTGEGRMIGVGFEDTPALRLGQAVTLFEGRFLFTGGLGTTANYDVTADGTRFIVATPPSATTEPPLTVLMNWQSLLEER